MNWNEIFTSCPNCGAIMTYCGAKDGIAHYSCEVCGEWLDKEERE